MNKVIIVGRLTRDPEVRYTQTGKAVASFSVAVDTGFGENKRADFIPVVVWDKLAEVCGNNLTKGRRVLVEGRLQIRDYEKDGQKRRAADVVAQNIEFLDTKQSVSGGGSNTNANTASPAKSSGYDVSSFGTEVFPEEEIPF
jgi:single-strand DNA-binding protein